MNSSERDVFVLERIIMYGRQALAAVDEFGCSEKAFVGSFTCRNACAMCILQIGELSGRLSDETKDKISDVPWRNIRGMRNILAHNYGEVDPTATWLTVRQDIPLLLAACERFLNSKQQ